MNPPLRLGLIAPKNTAAEREWLCSYLKGVRWGPYRRGGRYDVVWFLNVTEEARFLRRHTDARLFVVGMEPRFKYPLNYDAALLRLADVYSGYRNFAGESFRGRFLPFVFPAYPRDRLRAEFSLSLQARRDHAFCIMATHDPNIRRALAAAAAPHGCLAAGPLFGARFDDKFAVQRRARYELITENDITEYY